MWTGHWLMDIMFWFALTIIVPEIVSAITSG